MMHRRASFRGQPLVLLGVVLVGWACLRASFWEAPLAAVQDAASVGPRMAVRGGTAGAVSAADTDAAPSFVSARAASQAAGLQAPNRLTPAHTAGAQGLDWRRTVPALQPLPSAAPLPLARPVPVPASVEQPLPTVPATPLAAPPTPVPPRVAAGHNLLLLAGLASMEIPQAILAYLQPPIPPAAAPATLRPAPAVARWSADGWLMLRRDGASPLLSGRPGYGRSQSGAVLRYRLDPGSPRAPQVQLRASRALAGARESEVAAGLSVRPVPAVPLRVAAEMRLTQTDRGTRASPAAYAVTELPPVALPLGLRGEAYAQAGYVGGEFATPFVDGQARADRALVGVHGVQLRAGAGAWGGAQRGSARLDIGPTAALTFRVGDAQGRVAADYRLRVAGNAQPSSGPAITLSAGF